MEKLSYIYYVIKIKDMKGRKKSEFPRGYKVAVVNKTLNIGGKPDLYEVYVVEHKNLANPKTFVDKESVLLLKTLKRGRVAVPETTPRMRLRILSLL